MSARIKKHNRKTSEMIDEWLESKGLYRKHTARDGSCLFRAVAEQVFSTQVMHIKVRLSCVRYMGDNKDKFSHLVEGLFDNYLCNLQNPKEWAGQVEMNAMSEMFQRDFLVFREVGSQPCLATNNGFQEKIMLCQSQGNHYDSVYPRTFVANAAFCQSIVYEILYKVVFQLGDEVDLAVEKMLHDKVYAKHRKDSTASHDSACHSPESLPLLDPDLLGSDLKDGASEIRRALAMGIPPFPYKVAKALDPDIYRNVEFDIWNDIRKDEPVFEPGVKCLVRLTDDRSEVYHAHIQEVGNENEPVTVYVEELGIKCDVHYNQLEQLPSPVKKAPWQQMGKSYCAMSVSTCYQKTPVNGMYMDEDVTHQKRKPFKGKLKDYSYPIPIPHHGQSLPPRMQVPREPVIPFGRGRSAMPIPPYTRFKWSQSGSYGHRMYQRTGNYTTMNRFGSSGDNFNLPGVGNDQNHHGEDSHPPCDAQNQDTNFQAVSSQVTWMKSIQNSSPCPTGTFEPGQHALGNGNSPGQIDNLDNRAGLMPSTLGPGSATHDMSSSSDGHLNGSDAHYSNDVYMTQQGHGEPMGFCPYPFMPSVIVPFPDALGTSVNYNALRSQDVGGNDLPLLDLPTLRFFYNLGHDYFRMSALVHLPHAPTQAPYPSAYTVWQYNPINDCEVNTNAIDAPENPSRDHPTVHNMHTMPPMPLPFPVPVPMPMTADGTGAAVMYSRSPFTSPDESGYCTGSPLATELRTSLVLDDQGVLTFSNGTDDVAAGGSNGYRPGGQRCRSDSGESSGSWRGVRDMCRSSRQKHAGQRSGSISQQSLQRHEYSPLNGHEHGRSSASLCAGTNGNSQQQRGYVQLVPNDTVQVPTVAYPPRFGMARSPMAGPFITSPPSLSVSVGYYGTTAGAGTGPPNVPNPATSTPQAVAPMYATTYYSPQPCIYHQPTPPQLPYLPSATHNTQ